MNIEVQNYIDKKKELLKKQHTEFKNKKIIEWNLYEKIYTDTNDNSDEIHYSEWDEEKHCTVYYIRKPYDISDEQFEEIEKLNNELNAPALSKNNVATGIKIIAIIIYIIGFFAGLVFIGDEFIISVWYWIGSLITGTFILGFSEVIKLLHEINNKS